MSAPVSATPMREEALTPLTPVQRKKPKLVKRDTTDAAVTAIATPVTAIATPVVEAAAPAPASPVPSRENSSDDSERSTASGVEVSHAPDFVHVKPATTGKSNLNNSLKSVIALVSIAVIGFFALALAAKLGAFSELSALTTNSNILIGAASGALALALTSLACAARSSVNDGVKV